MSISLGWLLENYFVLLVVQVSRIFFFILLYPYIAVCAFERAVMSSRLYGLASMGTRAFIYEWV